MIKKLRRRLAFIFTAFTGIVLTAAVAASFSQSVYQAQENAEQSFINTVERVSLALLLGGDAPQSSVAAAAGDNAIVYVTADGQALDEAPGATQTTAQAAVPAETKRGLFQKAKIYAIENGLSTYGGLQYVVATTTTSGDVSVQVSESAFDETVRAGAYAAPDKNTYSYVLSRLADTVISPDRVFEIDDNSARYRATYFVLTTEQGQQHEAAVLEDLAGQTQSILLNGLWYLFIWLGGLALLFLANWALAGLVLRSTGEGLRRQTEFVAAASHELRSPLAVIRASLSAAKEARQDAEPQKAEKFNTAAMDEAERMGRLIDDLLLLAGGDTGSWQLQKAPVDLDTLLIALSESYAPLAKAKGLTLALLLPDETLPQPPGDAERLRQILAVLLDNALQYAPEGSEITLRAGAKKGRVNIAVADRGPGISEEEKERVFERFYRTDKSRHDKAHFGLGLSVARELAQLHGGRLAVSGTEGGGATFTLSLPVT